MVELPSFLSGAIQNISSAASQVGSGVISGAEAFVGTAYRAGQMAGSAVYGAGQATGTAVYGAGATVGGAAYGAGQTVSTIPGAVQSRLPQGPPQYVMPAGILRPSDIDLFAMQHLGPAAPAVISASDFLLGGRSVITPSGATVPIPSTGGVALSNVMSYAGVPIISQKTMDEINARAATGDVIARVQGIGAGVYQTVRTDPVAGFAVPLLASAGAGVAFEAGLAGLGYATAAAASSDLPVITTVGRLANTPIAADIGRISMSAAGTYLIGSTALDIAGQPTATAQGAKLAPAVSELVGFTAGASLVNFPTAYNPFKGREFISGELALSPLESTGLRVRTYIGSLTSSSPEAFRDIQSIYRAGRFVEPMRVSEPSLEELSSAGPFAGEIRGALVQTPHSLYGSSVVRSQVPEELTSKYLLRLGKDVDVYVQSPSELVAALPKEVAITTDPHSFPAGYPQVGQDIVIPEKSLAPEYGKSLLEKIFGEPISETLKLPKPSEVVRAGMDYPGELTYEKIGVQFGRKSQAAYRAIQDPIEYGYRLEKDIYDFTTLYQTQRETALATGAPITDFAKSDKAMEDFLTREITYAPVKEKPEETVTKTIAQIYEEFSGRLVPEEPGQFRINVRERGEPGLISPAVSTWTDVSPAFLPSISTLISPAISTVAPPLTPSVSAIESLSPSMPSPSVLSSMLSPFLSPSLSALSPSLPSPSLPGSPSLPSLSPPDISFPWSPSPTPSTPRPSTPWSPLPIPSTPTPWTPTPSTPGPSPPTFPTYPGLPTGPGLPGGGPGGFTTRGGRKFKIFGRLGLDIATFGPGHVSELARLPKMKMPKAPKIKQGKRTKK